MQRRFILAAVTVLALGVVSAFAQTPPDIPTPGADQTVYTGTVPAPAGTRVVLQLLDVATAQPVTCTEGTTFSSTKDTASTSTFALVLNRSCFQPTYQHVRICWAADQCDLIDPVSANSFRGGETVRTGLLSSAIAPGFLAPTGDGADVSLPAAGEGTGRERYDWILWAGVAAITGALVLDAGRRVRARSRR